MSTNMQAYERGIEGWNAGNIDAVVDQCAPDVEWRFSDRFPDATGTITGREAVREFLRRFRQDWSEISIVPHRVVEVGDNVVIDVEFRATGRDGIEVSIRFGHVWTGRDGVMTRFRAYETFDEALADVS
jgi:ketosteroid isomerase-like protein